MKIKNYFLVIFFVFTYFVGAFAQENKNYGILGGLNLTHFSKKTLKHNGTTGFSYHLGGFYELQIFKNFSLRTKVVYSRQGDRVKNDLDYSYPTENSFNYKLDYLNIPLDIKFFNKTYFFVGPQVGFLLKVEKVGRNFGEMDRNIDFGINFGLGQRLFKKYFVELQFYHGKSTAYSYSISNPTSIYANRVSYVKFANTLFQLSLGYNL